jgi:Putative peptidoglycan binding domain
MNDDMLLEMDREFEALNGDASDSEFEFEFEFESDPPASQGEFEMEAPLDELGFAPARRPRQMIMRQRKMQRQRPRPGNQAQRRGAAGRPRPGGPASGAIGDVFRAIGIGGAPHKSCQCRKQSSEYIRWLQVALNEVLGLRLATTGVPNTALRSALRSFQQQQGLTVDGVAGPETKRALVTARAAGAAGKAAPSSTEPPAAAAPASGGAANEFEFGGGNSWNELHDGETDQDSEVSGYRFKCNRHCPHRATGCQRIYEADRQRAIAMARKAAALLTRPETLVGGVRVADLYKRVFGHFPNRKVPWAGNASSAAVTIRRFQFAAKAMERGYYPVACGPCTGFPTANAVTTVGRKARIELCGAYWRNAARSTRAAILIHETLHAYFAFIDDTRNRDTPKTVRRTSAHCYEALAMLLNGKVPEGADTLNCASTPA